VRLPLVLLVSVITLGCSDDDERPPVVPCSGIQCHGPPILGSGANDGSGDGGEAGQGNVLPVFSVTRFAGDDFLATTPYPEPAAVLADGEGGTTLEAEWNGVDPFALEGLSEAPFVLVDPDGGQDAVPTVLVPPLRGMVELPLVRATVLESILALSSQPLDVASDRAHLVITLINLGNQLPVAGATLTAQSAETVLYAAAGSWSDVVSETDSSGLSLLASVDAAPWPGKLISVAVSGAASAAIPLRAVSGAVTVLYVGIEL